MWMTVFQRLQEARLEAVVEGKLGRVCILWGILWRENHGERGQGRGGGRCRRIWVVRVSPRTSPLWAQLVNVVENCDMSDVDY